MVSPEDVARRSIKAEKSMTVTTAPCAAGIGGDFSCHGSTRIRRAPHGQGTPLPGILHAESDGPAKPLPFTFVHHESESQITRWAMQIRNNRLIRCKALSRLSYLRIWNARFAARPCVFDMGNNSKVLALCAARPHIVAVR